MTNSASNDGPHALLSFWQLGWWQGQQKIINHTNTGSSQHDTDQAD